MAKQPKYRRTIGKDGKPRYFELKKDERGVEVYKPISEKKGIKKFVEKNYNDIKKPSNQKNLSEKELEALKRSKNQRDLYRIKGKPIKRWKTDLLEFSQLIPQDSQERDLTKLPTPYNRPSEIDKDVSNILQALPMVEVKSEIGARDFRDRTEAVGIHDIVERLDFVGSDNWKLQVMTEDGRIVKGARALEYVKNWEIAKTEELSDGNRRLAAVRFRYFIEYNDTARVIFLDINAAESEEMESDPVKRTR